MMKPIGCNTEGSIAIAVAPLIKVVHESYPGVFDDVTTTMMYTVVNGITTDEGLPAMLASLEALQAEGSAMLVRKIRGNTVYRVETHDDGYAFLMEHWQGDFRALLVIDGGDLAKPLEHEDSRAA